MRSLLFRLCLPVCLLGSTAALLLASDAKELKEPALTAEDRVHWAFQKPLRPDPPRVGDAAWVRTPVDTFVLARLEKAGLKPAPAADRTTLLRRVTFDLLGLPPTPEELDSFLHDQRLDAY